MTPTCPLCQTPGTNHRELTHTSTGTKATVCLICLRTKTQSKAARQDPRARSRLEQQARQSQTEVWEGQHVLYLTPPILPHLQEDTIVAQSHA